MMTGEAAYRRLNTLSPAGRALLGNGLFMEEFLYRLGPDARYRADEVPAIMCATLPHLSDDPERLWDDLAAALRPRGEASLAAHYRFVFEWLADHFGKRAWIERSGASLLFVPQLDTLFRALASSTFPRRPRHGDVHARPPLLQVADRGRGTAENVRLDPFHPAHWLGTSPWMPLFERWRFRFFSADRYRRAGIRLKSAGWFWSGMIERGTEYLNALPADRVLAMRFESIVASPEEEMSRFIDFLGADFRRCPLAAGSQRAASPQAAQPDPPFAGAARPPGRGLRPGAGNSGVRQPGPAVVLTRLDHPDRPGIQWRTHGTMSRGRAA